MLEQIKTLTIDQIVGGIFALVGALCPGFLIVYVFKPELISSLETIKLIIFSISLTLPIIILNIAIIARLESQNSQDEDYEIVGKSLLLSSILFYPVLLLAYLMSLNFKFFLLSLVLSQILIVMIVYFIYRKS